MNGVCPNCDENIEVPNTVKRGGCLDCPNCGEPLEIKRLYPLELDYDMSEYEGD